MPDTDQHLANLINGIEALRKENTAMRDCLLDCKAIIEAYQSGKRVDQYGSFNGQVQTLLHDIELLRNREDCPNYDYRKELK